jgi:hypothetical protein
MPGCYFKVAGTRFDPDAFLATTALNPYNIWHSGEPVAKVGPRSNRIHEWSGFVCNVSDVDGDLSLQIEDAVKFLDKHKADLVKLAVDPTVEDCRLDFGFDCRVGQEDVVVQGEWLPVELLKLAGDLKVNIALSIYPPLVEESTQ